MNEFTIEQAFEVRQQILSCANKHSPLRNVLQNIMNGLYDDCDENPLLEAENDLLYLEEDNTTLETVPVIGQVWEVKPDCARVWRPKNLTITYVKAENSDYVGTRCDYFTYEEQAETTSCWVFGMLENYTLVGSDL